MGIFDFFKGNKKEKGNSAKEEPAKEKADDTTKETRYWILYEGYIIKEQGDPYDGTLIYELSLKVAQDPEDMTDYETDSYEHYILEGSIYHFATYLQYTLNSSELDSEDDEWGEMIDCTIRSGAYDSDMGGAIPQSESGDFYVNWEDCFTNKKEALLKIKEIEDKLVKETAQHYEKKLEAEEFLRANPDWGVDLLSKSGGGPGSGSGSVKSIDNDNGINRIYVNGHLIVEGYKKNGLYQGDVKYYDADGLTSKLFYKDGVQQNGKIYYKNGNISEILKFKNGKKEGEIRKFYEDGTLGEIAVWKDGEKDGKYVYYHQNGNIQAEGFFNMGEQNGVWKQFDENGIIESESNWKDDEHTGKYKGYDKNGNLQEVCYLKKGKRKGLSTEYYSNGVILSEINYKDGKFDGLFKTYHKNGNLKEDFIYKDGLKEGLCKTYYEDGNLELERNFKKGLQHGLCKSFIPAYYEKNSNIPAGEAWYKEGKMDRDKHSEFDKADPRLLDFFEGKYQDEDGDIDWDAFLNDDKKGESDSSNKPKP